MWRKSSPLFIIQYSLTLHCRLRMYQLEGCNSCSLLLARGLDSFVSLSVINCIFILGHVTELFEPVNSPFGGHFKFFNPVDRIDFGRGSWGWAELARYLHAWANSLTSACFAKWVWIHLSFESMNPGSAAEDGRCGGDMPRKGEPLKNS